MSRKFTPARQVLNLANEALQRGDKQAARSWAQIAAWMMPNTEEPWLILAAVAKPQASVAYLERALKINPNNSRAREDLNLAYRQAKRKTPSVRQKTETSPSPAGTPIQPKTESLFQVSILMLELAVAMALALFLISAGGVWPGTNPSAITILRSNHRASLDTHIPYWLQAILAKPTEAPLPTSTFTLTATPSPSPLPTATPTTLPTATPSPTPSPSNTPTFTATMLPTNTAQPLGQQAERQFVATQPSAGSEKLIVVSIQEQHVYAYQGGTLVYSFIASTGVNNSTDAGTYHILDKLPDPYSYPWGFWMPDWMGIYYVGDVEDGFHALPVLDDGQRLWGNDLGTPASYGCIVLGVQDAQELYDWADVGTTIQINR